MTSSTRRGLDFVRKGEVFSKTVLKYELAMVLANQVSCMQ